MSTEEKVDDPFKIINHIGTNTENESPILCRRNWTVYISIFAVLISLIFSIIREVGAYKAKELEIELEREKIKATQSDNGKSKFLNIINTTMSQQGEERIYTLRLIKAIEDQTDIKEWASSEIERIRRLAEEEIKNEGERKRLKGEIHLLTLKNHKKQDEIDELKEELDDSMHSLKESYAEVEKLKQKTELVKYRKPSYIYIVTFNSRKDPVLKELSNDQVTFDIVFKSGKEITMSHSISQDNHEKEFVLLEEPSIFDFNTSYVKNVQVDKFELNGYLAGKKDKLSLWIKCKGGGVKCYNVGVIGEITVTAKKPVPKVNQFHAL